MSGHTKEPVIGEYECTVAAAIVAALEIGPGCPLHYPLRVAIRDAIKDTQAHFGLAGVAKPGEAIEAARDGLTQARGALLLDHMVDASGKPYGTTVVALETIDTALALLGRKE